MSLENEFIGQRIKLQHFKIIMAEVVRDPGLLFRKKERPIRSRWPALRRVGRVWLGLVPFDIHGRRKKSGLT